jgi:hypothetical protein
MKCAKRHVSYANIAATLALLFAMSGGALAANHYLIDSTKDIKPSVLKKLKGRAGKPGAVGKTGATGVAGATGAIGPSGPQGKEGIEGKAGTAGSAGAYAHVNADGTVDPARSKNVKTANVASFGGAYCFHDLPFVPKSVIASLTNFTVGFITTGVPPDIGTVCESGANVEEPEARVETYNGSQAPTKEAFDVIFN